MNTFDDSVVSGGWVRSSYSTGSGSTCVEVRVRPTGVAVRDSKDPFGPVLYFSTLEWRIFLRGVRSGEFDA